LFLGYTLFYIIYINDLGGSLLDNNGGGGGWDGI